MPEVKSTQNFYCSMLLLHVWCYFSEASASQKFYLEFSLDFLFQKECESVLTPQEFIGKGTALGDLQGPSDPPRAAV